MALLIEWHFTMLHSLDEESINPQENKAHEDSTPCNRNKAVKCGQPAQIQGTEPPHIVHHPELQIRITMPVIKHICFSQPDLCAKKS